MFRIIPLIILVIDIIVIMDIAKSNKDSEKKALWIIIVFFLPLLGPVLWYAVGKK